MDQGVMIERTRKMIDELHIKATQFANEIGIARSSLYSWWAGSMKFSNQRLDIIEQYLNRYGF